MTATTPARQLQSAVHAATQGSFLQSMLEFVKYEQGSGLVVARMPKDIPVFEEVWRVIQEVAVVKKIKVQRQGKWPTATEIRRLLGDVKWLWNDWLPVGFVTLLVGEPGSGKSFLALDWLKRVLKNTGWPMDGKSDTVLTTNNCAVWVETESSQQLVTSRAESMQVPGDRLYMPGFGEDLLGQPDLVLEEDRERVTQAVKELKPSFVVVDSLGGAHSGGENKIEEVRPMLDFLARLARDEKISVVAVHHLRKRAHMESTEASMDKVRGSTAFSAFARSIIAVEGAGNDHSIRVIKANLAEKAAPISFGIEFVMQDEIKRPRRIVYSEFVAPQGKSTKVERCMEWVVERLTAAESPVQLKAILGEAEPLGYSRNMLYAAKDRLGGQLTVTGDGRAAYWSLAAELDLSLLCES